MLTSLVTLGSALAGFVFKLMAQKQENDRVLLQKALKLHNAKEESLLSASSRDGRTGRMVRRLIVIVILFGTVGVTFLGGLFGIPTVVEVVDEWEFLIFSGKDVSFEYIYGFLILPEVRLALLSLVAFYLGQGAGAVRRR